MMSTREKLALMEDMSKTNAQRVQEFLSAGVTHVPPTIAAPMLGCVPYSLNCAARDKRLPDNAYYFAGRNLRISLNWLSTQV